MQVIQIIGNVGKDPIEAKTNAGIGVAELSVAVNRYKGEDKVTTWYSVRAFGKQAEAVLKILRKGSQVYIMGDYEYREYTMKDGKKGVSHDVSMLKFQTFDRPVPNTVSATSGNEDLPF